ncbi:MAG: 2Fe-2S iron-sulfur cluster-binding protein, partial [Pseudoruegeria sp.]
MRIKGNGLIDRNAPVSFRFDGKDYKGFRGDTLASALLANDVRLMARSFKYHRPRGVLSAGSEEPNALMTVGIGAAQTPNVRAT